MEPTESDSIATPTKDHALAVLGAAHEALGLDLYRLMRAVYDVERKQQYEEDPQVRLAEIRTLVTVAVDETMKGEAAPPSSDPQAP